MKPCQPIGGLQLSLFFEANCNRCNLQEGRHHHDCLNAHDRQRYACPVDFFEGSPCFPEEWVQEDDGTGQRCTRFERAPEWFEIDDEDDE